MQSSKSCSQHGFDWTVGCKDGCKHCMEALLQNHDEAQQEVQKHKKNYDEAQQEVQKHKKEHPSLADVASKSITLQSETASSAHAYANHAAAAHQVMRTPKVASGEEFWKTSTSCEFPECIDSEAEANSLLRGLLKDIVKALGMTPHVKVNLAVPVMDTVPDLGVTTQRNKLLVGTIEGKKPARSEAENLRIYGSGTDVAGEAFEQLHLCSIQNNTFSVGLLSTCNSFSLVSTANLSEHELSAKTALDFLNKAPANQEKTSTTPDKNKAPVDRAGKSDPSNSFKKAKVKHTEAPPKTKGCKNG